MNRIEAAFGRLRGERRKALIAYLTVGFPSMRLLEPLAACLQEGGVDLLELGIPFSDPLADGPTIQAASQKALLNGVTPGGVLKSVERLRGRGITLPIALMTYFNPVLRYGPARFCRDAVSAGADGVIVPDLPPEEAAELIRPARRENLDTIFLAAPTSPRERIRGIVRASRGFLYYVSLTGVTGARARLPVSLTDHVRLIKRMTTLPVCVGFGISRPDQVRAVTRVADGVIVGSALLAAVGRSGRPVAAASRFIRSLRRACG
ncbi:MAG: tryptophan synthase subunit alpha [Candidatus Omnitrophica bacterium]|nr:tryptophan synthase subunit alpha [Candidatus Omnitrophota bacterium]